MTDDDSDLDIELEATPTSAGIAGALIAAGICCITWAYVPVYGATPIALGLCIVAFNAVSRWAARRRA